MKKYPVTVHTLVKNEDQFVWYALASVLPFVTDAIIYDTGSTDKTWQIVTYLKNNNPFNTSLRISQIPVSSASEITSLRLRQLKETTTPWFLLVDGDEIWKEKEIIKLLDLTKSLPSQTLAVVNQTREVVGDIWHYLPQQFGKYNFFDKAGHYNIRLMRNYPFSLEGAYPNESYSINGNSINQIKEKLSYSDSWYLHASHLKRTSNTKETVLGRRRYMYSLGKLMPKNEEPEVFFENKPNVVDTVYGYRDKLFEIISWLMDYARLVKNLYEK